MILTQFLILPLIAEVTFKNTCKVKTTEKLLKSELDRVLNPKVYDIRLRPFFGTGRPVTGNGHTFHFEKISHNSKSYKIHQGFN